MVFADGNPEASVMLVGEAPAATRISRACLVGLPGQLLDRCWPRSGCDLHLGYIANVNPVAAARQPHAHAARDEICRPFIERQIELANPKILVALGGPSAKRSPTRPRVCCGCGAFGACTRRRRA